MPRHALAPIVAVAFTLAGCAKPPQAAIDGAKQAIDAARSADAGTYAPDAFREAEDAAARLETALRDQDQRAAFLRSYKNATTLAEAAQVAAQKAAVDAKVGKETMTQEVIVSIDIAREAAGYTNAALGKLPKGQAAQAAWLSVEADLAAAEAALADAESALSSGKVIDARTKAETASDFISKAKASTDAAPKPIGRR